MHCARLQFLWMYKRKDISYAGTGELFSFHEVLSQAFQKSSWSTLVFNMFPEMSIVINVHNCSQSTLNLGQCLRCE